VRHNFKALQTTINVLKLQRILSSSALVTVKTCATSYHPGVPLGNNIALTELQPADDLAILAATALINAHHLSVIEARKEGSTVESANTLQAPLFDTWYCLSKLSLRPDGRTLCDSFSRDYIDYSLAVQYHRLANLKSIQLDTLSHYVLSRASTLSMSRVGDVTLVNECVEISQIYSVNGVDVSVYSLSCAFADLSIDVRATRQGIPTRILLANTRICSP
jgi:N-terminal acetyltransferase B complex non-catalytic subunit